jgi:predicted oxidoreductase
MTEQKAVYYGQLELIPGIICDGYVLDDDTAVMSERGTADLLGMNHKALQGMATTGIPKRLKPFIDKDFIMATTLVKVTAKGSPYEGRQIVVYNSNIIETIIRAYVMAAGHNTLQKNQLHIGKRCSILASVGCISGSVMHQTPYLTTTSCVLI